MTKKCKDCGVAISADVGYADDEIKICWDCYDNSYEGQKNHKDTEVPFKVKVTYEDSLQCEVWGFSQENVIEYVEGTDWSPELFVRTVTTEVYYDEQKVYERMEVLN